MSAIFPMGATRVRLAGRRAAMSQRASKGCHQRLVELWDIVRFATGDQEAIDDHRLIYPDAAGIGQITAQ